MRRIKRMAGRKDAYFSCMITANSNKFIKKISFSRSGFYGLFTLFSILFIGFGIGIIAFASTTSKLSENYAQLIETKATMDSMQEAVDTATVSVSKLHTLINQITTTQNKRFSLQNANSESSNTVGDLENYYTIKYEEQAVDASLQQINYIASVIDATYNPLSDIKELLESQNSLLADIPNLWPLDNNHGNVTLEFGPNRHPKTNEWYLHKGIDIAGAYGVQVLASANGKVVEAGYDSGYGNYILLRHKYGFKTRYSHLRNIFVSEGQEIAQGESIATLGNTGISTGPHLDFQIILGTDVIDPSLFLKISRQQFQRWTGNR